MNLTCINCPLGCHLEITQTNNEIEVVGNKCPRGKQYAIDEVISPKRILTTTVRIRNAIHPCLPVISDKPIPKDKLFDCIKALKDVEVSPPIEINQIIVENILDLDINIVASRTMR